MQSISFFFLYFAAYLFSYHETSEDYNQGWKPGYLALGCQFQFWCVQTQMSGFSFGSVLQLLKNRFQFRFQFCLGTASVSGFQFRIQFYLGTASVFGFVSV